MLDIAIVTDPSAIALEWDALFRSDGQATPFQSPAWLLAWWDVFGEGDPLVVAARNGQGRLVGLLPLYRHRAFAPDEKLLLIGSGPTDYQDLVAAPDSDRLGLATALLAGLSLVDGAVRVDLADLRAGSALAVASPPASWDAATADGSTAPVLALDPALTAVPRTMRRNWRTAQRQAASLGPVRIRRPAGPADALAAFETLVRLHGQRWRARGEDGVLAAPDVLRFHRKALPALLAAHLLDLIEILVSGVPVGVYYGLRRGERGFAYLQGVAVSEQRQSFGTLLVGAAIEQLAASGARELHFLRGDEPYKAAWGALPTRTLFRQLVRQG